jgi:hypothetical protein
VFIKQEFDMGSDILTLFEVRSTTGILYSTGLFWRNGLSGELEPIRAIPSQTERFEAKIGLFHIPKPAFYLNGAGLGRFLESS